MGVCKMFLQRVLLQFQVDVLSFQGNDNNVDQMDRHWLTNPMTTVNNRSSSWGSRKLGLSLSIRIRHREGVQLVENRSRFCSAAGLH